MKRLLTAIFAFMMAVFCCCASYAGEENHAVTLGKTFSLASKVLNQNVPLTIHLPEDYDSVNRHYPVLYMVGSDYRTRFAMLASTLDYMADKQIPPMILVGLDFTEGNGILVPTRDTGDTTIPDSYIDFFESELIPYVDEKYRSAPFKILFGGSNSALFSVYTMLNKPELFNSYMASSPMFGWAPAMLEQRIKEGPLKNVTEKRYLHIIYSDDDSKRVTDFVPAFSRVLNNHKPERLVYKVDELVNQGHVPAADITMFLTSQFPDFNPREDLDTIAKVKKYFATLSKDYGYNVLPPASRIFDLGVKQTQGKSYDSAEKTFQYALSIYPENKRLIVGMGYFRREQGNSEEARAMFESALAIDPEYGLAKRLLKSLGE